jgi:hypothetical protein
MTNYNATFVENKMRVTLNINSDPEKNSEPVNQITNEQKEELLVILFDKAEVEMNDIKQKLKASKKAIISRFGSMTPVEDELPAKGRNLLKKMTSYHNHLLRAFNSRQLKRKDLKLRLNAERRSLEKTEKCESCGKLIVAKTEYEAALNSLKISIDKEKFKNENHVEKMLKKINDVLEKHKNI